MSGDKHDERRKFFRLGGGYTVHCEMYTIPRDPGSQDKSAGAKNISAGGILFQSDKKYAIGDVLRLEIEIPGWEKFKSEFYKPGSMSVSGPFVVIGDVVRVETAPGGKYEIGVKFSGLDEGHQWALLKYFKEQR